MAEQYDNTNSGAAFPPFPTQTMILQGNVDINSKDHRIILVQNTTKDGRKTIEVYQKMGILFENDKKGNEQAPDYSGPLDDHDNLRIAGWRKKAKDSDKHFISLKISEGKAFTNDQIPF
tara:strand:- start:207 stop:563 length:357 start_codon:yes stop_codon:yes gene_type:complete